MGDLVYLMSSVSSVGIHKLPVFNVLREDGQHMRLAF